jgi:hypothetical protein
VSEPGGARAPSPAAHELPPGDPFALRWLPLLVLAFHLSTAHRYGIFRDELYYLACGQHLAFGYVDHPPLVALLAALARALFGDWLVGLRILPALMGAATAHLTARLARELGGGAYAQRLSALCVTLGGNALYTFQVLSMNATDHLAWVALWWIAARALRRDDAPLWPLFGLVAGLGLENKISVLFLGFGVAVGLVLFRRDVLARRGIWIGALLAGLLFLPHALWQAANGFPTREFIANAQAEKMVNFSPLEFLARAALEANPASLPVWVAGLVALAFLPRWKSWRTLGAAFAAVLLLLAFTRSKPYYAAPAFALVFAAGGAVLEALGTARPAVLARAAVFLLALAGGALVAPLAKPLLPADEYVLYAAHLGIEPSSAERQQLGRLPQHFADMFGWRELAETVARVHRTLPEADRAAARVFGQNYGEAGAIDFFGPELGLPAALSAHNSYFLWGPGDWTGEVLIVIDDERERLLELFEEVELGATFECANCMPYESRLPIWVCRGLKMPVAELWPQIKHYI